MPVIVNKDLPAANILQYENIPILYKEDIDLDSIDYLKICILNLMPTKLETEAQLLRLLSSNLTNIDVTFIYTETYNSKNTSYDHIKSFYKTFNDIKNENFDGMIITGSPVENMKFEEVDYWNELKEIMEYAKSNVNSTLYICWGAQAGLYYNYGINKYPLSNKVFGVFKHKVAENDNLLKGFDDVFYAPHSRHTEVKKEDLDKVNTIKVLSYSEDAGVYIASDTTNKQVFVMGHSEYDPYTLRNEYTRDISKGIKIEVPKNYFKDDNPSNEPIVRWRSHGNLLFSNWINYYLK